MSKLDYLRSSPARLILSRTGLGRSADSPPKTPQSVSPTETDRPRGMRRWMPKRISSSTATLIGAPSPRAEPSPTNSYTDGPGPSRSSTKATGFVDATRTVLSMCSSCGKHAVLTLKRRSGRSRVPRFSTTQEISFLCSTCGTSGSFDHTGILSVTFVESLKRHGLPRWVSSGREWRTSSKNLSRRSH